MGSVYGSALLQLTLWYSGRVSLTQEILGSNPAIFLFDFNFLSLNSAKEKTPMMNQLCRRSWKYKSAYVLVRASGESHLFNINEHGTGKKKEHLSIQMNLNVHMEKSKINS